MQTMFFIVIINYIKNTILHNAYKTTQPIVDKTYHDAFVIIFSIPH